MNAFESKYFNDFNFNLEKNFELNFSEAESVLKIRFQESYKQIIQEYNGGSGDIGQYYIELWSIEDIVDFFEEIEDEDRDGIIVFASNGCGMAFAFSRNSEEVLWVLMESIDSESCKKCSDSFTEFVENMYLNKLTNY